MNPGYPPPTYFGCPPAAAGQPTPNAFTILGYCHTFVAHCFPQQQQVQNAPGGFYTQFGCPPPAAAGSQGQPTPDVSTIIGKCNTGITILGQCCHGGLTVLGQCMGAAPAAAPGGYPTVYGCPPAAASQPTPDVSTIIGKCNTGITILGQCCQGGITVLGQCAGAAQAAPGGFPTYYGCPPGGQ